MQSFLLPANIQIYSTENYLIIKYNDSFFIKKIDNNIKFNIIKTREGDRLFTSSNTSSILSHLYNLTYGLSRGYQQRLRLIGIGFRAITNSISDTQENTEFIKKVKITSKSYMHKYFIADVSNKLNYISIKLGYSHEVAYPINNNIKFNVSAIDGRSKGILIDLKSNDYSKLNKAAIEIRSFRYPDSYKGKGIFYNKERPKLKKGKRQG